MSEDSTYNELEELFEELRLLDIVFVVSQHDDEEINNQYDGQIVPLVLRSEINSLKKRGI